MLRNNPFLSSTFTQVWLKYFNNESSAISVEGIQPLQFIKHPRFSFYTSCGKTNTKGISYEIDEGKIKGQQNEVFLVYDVPIYLPIPSVAEDNKLKRIRIPQYPGYLIDLKAYTSFDTYMTSVFKGKSRRKFTAYKRKLEREHDISYKMFYGDISKEEYDSIFKDFKKMLEKRFQTKKEVNNNLNAKEWAFYKEVTYPMILEKKASLFVMFREGKPISVLLSFMTPSHIILGITGFDIAYQNYNIGTVNIMCLLQWGFENNFSAFDFSKGHYDYKTRWGSVKYDFEYHILYDSSSWFAAATANTLAFFFRLKQYLRDKGVNTMLNRLYYS